VAVIQISKVQVRRGQTSQTGFPQLASGEFGWSIDQQQLYIGNGSVSEGAPAVGNTRLLTEHDTNIFLLSAPYTYENDVNAAARLLQNRLDDYLNVYDYGAAGDGATPDTHSIQTAVNRASLEKKALDFNQGTFLVTSTIYVPPNVEIRGFGAGKTVIVNASTSTIFATVDATGNLPTNITSAANTPQNVNISGITFISSLTNAAPMIVLNSLLNSSIQNCMFKGNPSVASSSTMATAITLTGSGALTCDTVAIKDCKFQSLSSAIVSDYDISNINIFENDFNNLDAGIIFAKNLSGQAGSLVGPTNVNVANNTFDTINSQALYVGTNTTGISTVKSSGNSYKLVGIGYNGIQGDFGQTTDVITFGTFGSMSNNDTFSRLTALNSNNISSFAEIQPVINGPVVFNTALSTPIYISGYGTISVFAWPRFTYNLRNITCPGQTINVDYVLSKAGTTRRGTVEVNVDNSDVTIKDTFSFTGLTDGDMVFSVDTSRNDVILIKATSQFNQGINGILTYTISVKQ